MINIDKNKTICVSGHRKISVPVDRDKLASIFNCYIDKGIDTFLVGMAIGFDTICFQVLEKLREKNNIKIIACIPCLEQDKMFSEAQKKEYKRMIKSADERIILSEKYTPYCMMKRNRFMVDNSSMVLAYLVENKGGTFATIKYAKEKKLEIVILPTEKS